VRLVAKLGGFVGRQNDGHPGVTTIWRGLQKLHDIEEYFLMFQKLMGKS
jgi:hypothetical protein